jgi:RAB protein geranylgeranyltransferase component A
LISSLISSGVSRYGGFKLLERIALYNKPGYVNSVPSTKEDIFKDKQISLVEKRRLMRFFTFAAGEFEGEPEINGSEDIPLLDFLKTKFSVTDKVAETIAYALAFCTSTSGLCFTKVLIDSRVEHDLLQDPTLPALKRIRRYLRSSGRYGASPFLVGHYGGSGEIVQGFCRASAVNGSTYILGPTVLSLHSRSDAEASSLTSNQRQHNIVLQDFDESISCDLVITSPDYIQKAVDAKTNKTSALARCIAIIDQPLVFSPFKSDHQLGDPTSDSTDAFAVDTAVLIFPPSCLADYPNDTAVHAFVTGEGSMSAPKSRCTRLVLN